MENLSEINVNYIEFVLSEFEKTIKNDENRVYIGWDYDENDEQKLFFLEKERWIELLTILYESSIQDELYEYSSLLLNMKNKITELV